MIAFSLFCVPLIAPSRLLVLDSNSGKVLHIDFLAPRLPSPHPSPPTIPPSLIEDSSTQRTRIPPPLEPQEYLPEFMPDGFKYRDTLKPLHVVQPEGVSFKLDGGRLSWEKWDRESFLEVAELRGAS